MVNTANGTVAQRIDYDEFGRVTQNSNPGFQPFGYAGGLYDEQTGLVRFGARDYDPVTGQWTAKEPLGFGGGDANLYAYAGNDPLSSVDPTGEDPVLAAMALRMGGCALAGALESMLLQSALNGCVDYGQVGIDALIGVGGCALPGILGRIGRYLDDLGEAGFVRLGGTGTKRLTYLYQKVGAKGEHLKFGITNNPATRYSAAELNGGRLRIITKGERSVMLGLERQLHEILPIGPEEGQLSYILKQVAKGLKPPPY